ncbi:MAG: ribulose-phosphate 3-epimerase [Rubrobacter sp.]|nr:ribulose-phosphate 3-epimerase [Rubrobacter sp.]
MGLFSELGGRVVGGPSILAANFAYLADEVEKAEEGGAEFVHFDAMDNQFVSNLTIGPMVAASLVPETSLPVDAHLMVQNPDNLIPAFLEAGVKSISVQPEAVVHLHRTLTTIRDGGVEAGLTLNPTTPPESIEWAIPHLDFILVMSVNPGFGGQKFIPETIEKIRRIKEMCDLPIQVDGGIKTETAPLVVKAGAQVLVAGSAVYKGDPAVEMRRIIEAGRSGGPGVGGGE